MLPSGCFTSGLISCSCLSLAVPSSGFPYQIFCSRTTAAPSLQSSPLIHTTDILAHVSSPLSPSLSLSVHSAISALSGCAWDHVLNMLLTVQTNREGTVMARKCSCKKIQQGLVPCRDAQTLQVKPYANQMSCQSMQSSRQDRAFWKWWKATDCGFLPFRRRVSEMQLSLHGAPLPRSVKG